MWVGTQTSQVEIKLSLKACQVRKGRYYSQPDDFGNHLPLPSPWAEVWKGHCIGPAGLGRLPRPTVFLTRYIFSTHVLKKMRGHAACAWSAKAMSSGLSPAASMPGAPSAKPQPRQYLDFRLQ